MVAVGTDLLYLRDAEQRSFDSVVTAIVDGGIVLAETCFYVTGGGQPHDTGSLTWEGGTARVIDVRKDRESGEVVHVLEGDVPNEGTAVHGEIDWDRRHALMRTHTALHVLCGVIWNEYKVAVTGGNMEPLSARMDFEFDPLPEGFGRRVEELVNAELAAARPVEVVFLPRGAAVGDADLIRTKVNLIPESVREIRVVDIVGLDKQADGGTHVARTDEVGRIQVVKTESKGRSNKRIRLRVLDG